MKKIIISAAAALIVGIVLALRFCLTPSEQVYCFTLSGEGTLYTVAKFERGNFLRVVNQEKGLDRTERLDDVIKVRQYLDIICYRSELFLMSQGVDGDKPFLRVDRFTADGSWKGEVLTIPLSSETLFFSADFCEAYDQDRENPDILNVVLTNTDQIFTQEIGSGGKTGELRRYALEEGTSPGWAGVTAYGVVYFDSDDHICFIDSDMKQRKFNIDKVNLEDPFMFSHAIYGVSLNDISLSGFLLESDYDEKAITDIYYVPGLGNSSADREIADGIRFSDLRDVGVTSWSSQSGYYFIGIVKPDGERGKIVCFSDASGNSKVYDEPLLPLGRGILVLLIVSGCIFVGVLLLLFIGGRLLSLRKVVVKQFLISLVLIAVSFGIMFSTSNVFMKRILNSTETVALRDILDYVAGGIDEEAFDTGVLPDETLTLMQEYEDRSKPLYTLDDDLYFPRMYTLGSVAFIRVAKLVEGKYYYIYYYGSQEPGALASYYTSTDTLDMIRELTPDEYLATTSHSQNRKWMEESRAIFDSAGNNIGFVMAGCEYNELELSVSQAALRLSIIWGFLFTVICAAFLLFLVKLLYPLKKIKKAVSEISEGKIGTRVVIKTNDELQDIAASFSEMSVKLEDYFNSINVISKAYERYLPKDFFRLMDKRSVLDVSPEDSREVVLNYLFIGINMNRLHSAGTDGFSALNRIYGLVSATVSGFGGAVQSLDDRQMTCIFSGETSSAVEAALSIREKLTAEALNDAEVKITLQRADSTIGVIGTGEAMKPVTVSSAIEMQQYIAAVMKEYDLSYVLTDNVKKALCGVNVTLKYIGTLSELGGISGKRFEIGLYEVPEGCCGEEKQLRLSTLAAFNRGMDEYRAGHIREARSHFIEVLRVNRGDLIARRYLMLCEGGDFLKENKNELKTN